MEDFDKVFWAFFSSAVLAILALCIRNPLLALKICICVAALSLLIFFSAKLKHDGKMIAFDIAQKARYLIILERFKEVNSLADSLLFADPTLSKLELFTDSGENLIAKSILIDIVEKKTMERFDNKLKPAITAENTYFSRLSTYFYIIWAALLVCITTAFFFYKYRKKKVHENAPNNPNS